MSSADSATSRRPVSTTNQQPVRRSLRLAAGSSKCAALTGTAKRDPSSLRCSRYKRLKADPSSGQLLALCRDDSRNRIPKRKKTNSKAKHKMRIAARLAPAQSVWKQIPRRREKSCSRLCRDDDVKKQFKSETKTNSKHLDPQEFSILLNQAQNISLCSVYRVNPRCLFARAASGRCSQCRPSSIPNKNPARLRRIRGGRCRYF